MKSLSILQKFSLLSTLFIIVLAIEIGLAFNLNGDNSRLIERDTPVLIKTHELKLSVVQVQQWLTDISATRGMDGLNDGFTEAEKQSKNFKQLVNDLSRLDSSNRDKYRQLIPLFESYYAAGRKMAQAYVDAGPEAGNKMMSGFDTTATVLTDKVDSLLTSSQQTARVLLTHQEDQLALTRNSILIASLILATIMLLIFLFVRGILKVLPEISSQLEDITHGNLAGNSIEIKRRDEIGDLIRHIGKMKDGLKDVIAQVSSTSITLFNNVQSISGIAHNTSNGMQQQENEAQQLATAMNEMAATATEVARNAADAADAVHIADQQAAEGMAVVADTIRTINNLSESVERTASVIHELEEDSANIGSILEVIRGIAEQTNLLALNAAIEAARAGEQGRGFAVVADEVRTLAGRTQDSTRQIQTVIERLQTTSTNAVKVMEEGVKQAGEGVKHVCLAEEKLKTISGSISIITNMNTQIASAAEEQSAVSEEMNRNVVRISEVSSQTSITTQHLIKTSNALDQQASELKTLVNAFRL